MGRLKESIDRLTFGNPRRCVRFVLWRFLDSLVTSVSTVVTGCMYLAQKRGRTRHGCAIFASLPPQVDIASVGSPDRDVTRGTAV